MVRLWLVSCEPHWQGESVSQTDPHPHEITLLSLSPPLSFQRHLLQSENVWNSLSTLHVPVTSPHWGCTLGCKTDNTWCQSYCHIVLHNYIYPVHNCAFCTYRTSCVLDRDMLPYIRSNGNLDVFGRKCRHYFLEKKFSWKKVSSCLYLIDKLQDHFVTRQVVWSV